MNKISRKLTEWTTHGLLTEEQKQSILKYEEESEGPSKVLFGFMILGFSIIGIGVISLIAANWKYIPDSMKLGGNFLLLIGVATFAFKKFSEGKELAYEVATAFLMFLFLATIGLISQIYHTGGELHQALFLWCFITALIAFTSKRSFVPYLWCAGFFGSILLMLFNKSFLYRYYGKSYVLFFMALPYLSVLLTILMRKLKGRESPQYNAFNYWSVKWLFLGLFAMEVMGKGQFKFLTTHGLYVPGYLMSTLLIVIIATSQNLSQLQKTLLLILCVGYLVPFHLYYFEEHLPLFLIKPAVTITCLISLALFSVSIGKDKLFSKLLTLVGLRFLVLYFQAFGGLAYTGFGLILSGLIIIGLVYQWNKHRKKIENWAKGMVLK